MAEGSVSLPFSMQVPVVSMTLWHVLIWALGLVFMNVLGLKLDRSYNVIRSQAVMDALTGIPNRRSFSERILAEFTISRKSDAELSVIMCDIDNFKKYITTDMVISRVMPASAKWRSVFRILKKGRTISVPAMAGRNLWLFCRTALLRLPWPLPREYVRISKT